MRRACRGSVARDQAVRDLALIYAQQIDNMHKRCSECECQGGADLTKIGPALLAALEALQLSPRARKAVTPVAGRVVTKPLNELAERRARKSRAKTVDPAAP